MKKPLLLLSLVLGATLPVVAHADEMSATPAKITRTTSAKPAKPARATSPKVTYYITQETHTGSNIPMVYRRYGNRIDSASNPAVYGQRVIRQTGQLDVGTSLSLLDPSISVHSHG